MTTTGKNRPTFSTLSGVWIDSPDGSIEITPNIRGWSMSVKGGSGGTVTWEDVEDKPVGTTRQVLGFDSTGDITNVTLGWEHFSDQPNPPSFTVGVLGWNQDLDEFGFLEVSDEPKENSLPMYRPDGSGQISVEDPEELSDAVNLKTLLEKVPNLTKENIIIGGDEENEYRRILPSDLNITSISGAYYSISAALSTNDFSTITARVAPHNGGIPISSSNGLRVSPPGHNDAAIRLIDYVGVQNNDLTVSETSVDLNAAYPTAIKGSFVFSITNSVLYQKLTDTDWHKQTLTIV